MRIRYLVRFEKMGSLKFIGHLDLLRLMHRCVKRSGIDIDYSKGFNPHQLVSVAQPLAVGMEGLSEYAVFEMKNKTAESEILDRLNLIVPEGLKFTGCRSMAETEKSAASIIRAAEFSVTLHEVRGLAEEIDKILASPSLKVQKPEKYKKVKHDKRSGNSRNSENELIDIRSDIYNIYATGEKSVNMLIAQGSVQNLKPELVTLYISGKMGVEYIPHKTAYIRRELYRYDENGNFVSLYD